MANCAGRELGGPYRGRDESVARAHGPTGDGNANPFHNPMTRDQAIIADLSFDCEVSTQAILATRRPYIERESSFRPDRRFLYRMHPCFQSQ
jgi:hypothetical protein